MRAYYILIMAVSLFFLPSGCSTPKEEEISLHTQICLTARHHGLVIPETEIYVKWNSELFPGYRPEDGYDTSYLANSAGKWCISDVPFGTHWFLGFGFDHQIQELVWGLLGLDITLKNYRIDTTLDVNE